MKLKKLIIEGIIATTYRDSWHAIVLIQKDGYRIDLISRFIELDLNSQGGQKQVNYYLSDNRLEEIELKMATISKLVGGISAEYDKHDFQYSSWTSDTSYTQELRVGGHDLYNELITEIGRFVRFEINYTPNEI